MPKSYSPKGVSVPLIIFLHNLRESGSELKEARTWDPPAVAAKDPEFPFMAVSPRAPQGERSHARLLRGMIDEVLANYNVDRNRVYMAGPSIGGYGT